MDTIRIIYLRLSPRSNWMFQSSTVNDLERHNMLFESLKNDCQANFYKWLERHPNYQIGVYTFERDLNDPVQASLYTLDNLKPSDTRVKIIE